MDIEIINITTGERTWRDYTPEELLEIKASNVQYTLENPPPPKRVTLDSVVAVLKAKNVINDIDIEAAKL